MSKPRNSAEVALKLLDHARSMGIPARMENSLIQRSDSRYVVLFPNTTVEALIRISSHTPFEDRYALCIDVSRESLLDLAVPIGVNWMEEKYGDGSLQEIARRNGLAASDPNDRRSGRDGRLLRRQRIRAEQGDEDNYDRVRRRVPGGVRNSGPLKERPRGQSLGLRFELSGDD